MFNRQKTLEKYGYDLDLSKRRRTEAELEASKCFNKKDLLVVDNCPLCQIERYIKLRQSRKNKPCSKCFHNLPSTIEAKQNQTKIKSEEHKQKMRDNHHSKKEGYINEFKGKKHTEETKSALSDKQKSYMDDLSTDQKTQRYIKSSCSFRGIPKDEFNGWSTEESIRIRGSKVYKDWEKSVFERDKACQFPTCLERRVSELVAHHKDGFSWSIDRRFDVSNGVLLCKHHHNLGSDAFHKKYGNRDNTEQQYDQWIDSHKIKTSSIKDLYIITGAPGSGKSWVCNQLIYSYKYISYDDIPKEQHLYSLLKDSDKPLIYDPWRKATSFLKRYSTVFNMKLIVIAEDESVLESRLVKRGGTFDEKSKKYCQRAKNIAKNATFSGTSQEVLDYLKKLIR